MTVAIIKTTDPRDVREAVRLLGGMERFISPGDRTVLKPNICIGKPSSSGAVTDPELMAETARLVQEVGGKPVIGESPIYPFGSNWAFKRAGYGDFQKRYGFEMVAFDHEEGVHVQIPKGKALDHLVIARRVLQSERLINMPVAKTHLQTIVTLGLKNLKGVVVGKHKQIIHMAGLDEGIVDLNTAVKTDLTIIDGIIGLEGEIGATIGTPVPLGVILAADNVVEADATMSRIMGLDPEKIIHIKMAAARGLGRLDGFEIRGEPVEKVARKFRSTPRYGLYRTLISDYFYHFFGALHNLSARIRGTDAVRARQAVGEVRIAADRCNNCKLCLKACPVEAVSLAGGVKINRETCIRCFICAEVCPVEVFSK